MSDDESDVAVVNTADNDEGDGDTGFICPHCKQPLDVVYVYGKAPYGKCPKCGGRIGKTSIPPEIIEYRERRVGNKNQSATPALLDVPEQDVSSQTSLLGDDSDDDNQHKTLIGEIFREPTTVHEVLKEVLEEFGVNEAFINLAIRRSQRVGGLHPADLKQMLVAFKSGVTKESQAAYIADEYAAALQSLERGSNDDLPAPAYRVSVGYDNNKYALPHNYTSAPAMAHAPHQLPQDYARQRRYSDDYDLPSAGFGNDTMQILHMVRNSDRQYYEIRNEMERMRASMHDEVREVANSVTQALNAITDKIRDIETRRGNGDTITRQDLELLKKETELDKIKSEMDALHKTIERTTSSFDRTISVLSEKIDNIIKEYNRLVHDVKSKPDAFETDAGRLAAQGIKELSDTLERRRLAEKALALVAGQNNVKKGRAPIVEDAQSDSTLTIADLVDDEYVEDGDGDDQ